MRLTSFSRRLTTPHNAASLYSIQGQHLLRHIDEQANGHKMLGRDTEKERKREREKRNDRAKGGRMMKGSRRCGGETMKDLQKIYREIQ